MVKLRVVHKIPGELPEVKMVDNELQDFKTLVGGGYIETTLSGIPGVLVVVDEEGKLKSLPVNFSLPPLDVIVGPCFFVRSDPPEFASLTDEDIEWIMQAFNAPAYQYDVFDNENQGGFMFQTFTAPTVEDALVEMRIEGFLASDLTVKKLPRG